MKPRVRATLLALGLALPAAGGEIPSAELLLEAAPATPGSLATGAPPRFALLRDGQVFVGGSERLEAGRLAKGEAQALRKRVAALRKLPGIASPVAFGGGSDLARRLRLLEDDPLEIVASGDPAAAPAALAPLAAVIEELERFHHPSLRPYKPSQYAVTAREARLVGGCRGWTFPVAIAAAVAGPRAVAAAEAEGWPTGAMPASVCAEDRRYSVTLRPLLPDEQP